MSMTTTSDIGMKSLSFSACLGLENAKASDAKAIAYTTRQYPTTSGFDSICPRTHVWNPS